MVIVHLTSIQFSSIALEPRFQSKLSQCNSIAELVDVETCLKDALVCTDVRESRTDWIVERSHTKSTQFNQFTFSV